jgi:hypothetical protein
MVIGYNDTEYKGIIQQKGVKDWYVEGDIVKDTLQLLVTNDDEEVVGYIQGIMEDSLLTGRFLDDGKAFQRNLDLKRVLKHRSTELCGDNKWLRTFEGQLMQESIELALQREEEDVVIGLIFFEEKDVSYDLFGQCLDDACDRARFEVKNPQDVSLGSLDFEKDKNGVYWVEMGTQISSPMNATQDLPMVCGSRFFKGSRLSYVYPYFENKRTDEWLKARANKWLSLFQSGAEFDQQDYRFWVDLDFVGERMISGSINYNHPQQHTPYRESFILPTNEDKPIEIWQWVADEDIFRQMLNEAVYAEKERRISHEPEVAQSWLEKQKFHHISIRQEGLCLKTGLSLIYGDRKMIVPWNIVEPYVKRFVNVKKYLR